MTVALQLAVNILIATALYGLIASGFSVFYAVSRVQHLAYGGVVTGAGYIFLALLERGAGVLMATLGAIATAMLLGLLCNALLYERLQNRRVFSSLVALISSLILLTALQSIILLGFGSRPKVVPLEAVHASVEIGGAVITVIQIVSIVAGALLIAGFALYLKYSRLGMAIRATADNPEVAEVIGINTKKIRYLTMLISSLLAGVAGVLIAIEYNLEPYASTLHAVRAFARTIVAGVGSPLGVLPAGIMMDGAENIGGYFLSNSFKEVYAFMVVVLFLFLRPQGMFGPKRE